MGTLTSVHSLRYIIGEKKKSIISIPTARYGVLDIGDDATSPFSNCTIISFKKHREAGQTTRGDFLKNRITA
jgi:hypothetical protein